MRDNRLKSKDKSAIITERIIKEMRLCMKQKLKKLGSNLKTGFLHFKNNPKQTIQSGFSHAKNCIKKNPLFTIYVLSCVINATLLRFMTMHTLENYLCIKAIIADTAVVIVLGSFCYLLKPKFRFFYLFFWEVVFTAICLINSIYFTFYDSFASFSMLALTQYIGEVGDAVTENVMEAKDLLYLWGPILLLVFHRHLKKRKHYQQTETKLNRKKRFLKTMVSGVILAGIFIVLLTPLEIGRFSKQWDRKYVAERFGIYTYQFNDLVKSIEPQINSLFGYDQAKKEFKEYFEDRNQKSDNEYTNIFQGKNVIAIHAESMQQFLIDLKFNGQEVTPNLNRIAHEGLYFSNFYSQVSVGTSSDTELTLATSLMPTKNGTAFVSYSDKTYISMYQQLREKGYYTFSMHANTADFWNRRIMHQNLGYDHFYSKKDYEVNKENWIGLGLSDKSFFFQSIPKIKEVKEKGKPFYGTMIMLSNHTPFSEVNKYGEFDVDIKETVTQEDGTEMVVDHEYMEGTKLGNYFKSAHYADAALGEFLDSLEQEGLLENTVFVLYGDHDARLPKSDYIRMYNYDTETDSVKSKEDPTYIDFDSYQYELNRKVPLIIWSKESKDDEKLNKQVTDVMGMYDLAPTLGNMMGVYNPYQLGHDIFTIKEDNIVVFPNSNWVTNKIYYNSQQGEYLPLKEVTIDKECIEKNIKYTEELLDVSNHIIVFDLLKETKKESTKGEQE